MATWIAGIIAVAKAIPVVDGWLKALMLAYAKMITAKWNSDLSKAFIIALETGDQRELEKAINSPIAGLPSGNPGTVIKPPEWMP